MPEAKRISVAILYTPRSSTGERNWQLAEYIALSVACNTDVMIYTVPCPPLSVENTLPHISEARGIIHPNGRPVNKCLLEKKERYSDGNILNILSCDLWVLYIDKEHTLATMRSIQRFWYAHLIASPT